jgi:hypothetical protein
MYMWLNGNRLFWFLRQVSAKTIAIFSFAIQLADQSQRFQLTLFIHWSKPDGSRISGQPGR